MEDSSVPLTSIPSMGASTSRIAATFRRSIYETVGPCNATWFGGDNDPDDNGETASGLHTKGHPLILGCALPVHATHATPHPYYSGVPWGTAVKITRRDTGACIIVPLIDNGPADGNPQGALIDLTVAAFASLGVPAVNHRPTHGVLAVYFKVLAGEEFAAWGQYRTAYRGR